MNTSTFFFNLCNLKKIIFITLLVLVASFLARSNVEHYLKKMDWSFLRYYHRHCLLVDQNVEHGDLYSGCGCMTYWLWEGQLHISANCILGRSLGLQKDRKRYKLISMLDITAQNLNTFIQRMIKYYHCNTRPLYHCFTACLLYFLYFINKSLLFILY